MTMGPEPISRIDLMSLRRGTELLHPPLEDGPGVVRARTGLGMELHRPRAQVGVVEALDRAVVERDVCRLATLGRAHGEAVVLARHEHAARAPVDHGMVRAAVAERELEGLVPGREREQ